MSVLNSATKVVTKDVVKPMNLLETIMASAIGGAGYAIVSSMVGTFIDKSVKAGDTTNPNKNAKLAASVITSCVIGAAGGYVLGGTAGNIIQNGMIITPMGDVAGKFVDYAKSKMPAKAA